MRITRQSPAKLLIRQNARKTDIPLRAPVLEQFISSSSPHVGEELTVNPSTESILVEYFYSEKSYD